MKNLREWVLVGQLGGRKWIVGDYCTEEEAFDAMIKKTKEEEKFGDETQVNR